ncbi:MAG: sensor domain-containing diguanylate cyclase [Candidatus Firestonebacteria bacterium]
MIIIKALFYKLMRCSVTYLFLFFVLFLIGGGKWNFWVFLLWIVGFLSLICVDLKNYKQIKYLATVNKQLSYVEQLTHALRSSTKLDDVLKIVLKNLTEELHYDRVLIYSLERDKRKKEILKPIASLGVDFNMLNDHIFKLDKSLDIIPRVAIEQKSYIIRDAPNDHRCSQEFVSLLGFKEYVVLSLVIKNVSIGVLLADNVINKRPIEESDLVPLTFFANQVAIAIENAKLYERIEYLAIVDGLTNVYNHRYFYEKLKDEIDRISRYGKQGILSMIMLDVDHFKNYNDINGHLAGDSVLIEIGQILKNMTRKVDLVARYGGEEFMVILPETSKEGAIVLAERIRQVIEKYPFESRENQHSGKVTVSLGVASYGRDGTSPDVLVEAADKGLYLAKASGRNKVCFVGEK